MARDSVEFTDIVTMQDRSIPDESVGAGWAAAAVIVQLLVAFPTFLKIMPPTSGFFLYWAKQATERTIYKDFLFPLTPFGLLTEGTIPNLFPNPFLAEQWIQLIKWCAITIALFWLLRLCSFEKAQAFIGTTIAAAAYYCSAGNITAGYLETSWLFVILSGCFVILAFRVEGKARQRNMFLFGLFISLAFLTKQSAVVPTFVLFLTLALVLGKTIFARRSGFILAIIGAASPILVYVALGLIQGNLVPALQTIFSPIGKEPGNLLWVNWLADGIFRQGAVMPAALAITGAVLLSKNKSDEVPVNFGHRSKLVTGLSLISLGFLGLGGLNLLATVPEGKFANYILFAVLAVVAAVLYFDSSDKGSNLPLLHPLVLVALFIGAVYFGNSGAKIDMTAVSWTSQAWLGINTFGAASVIGLGFVYLLKFREMKGSSEGLSIIFVAAISLGFALMNVLSGGLGVETWLVSLGFGVAWLTQKMGNATKNIFGRALVMSFPVIMIVPLLVFQSGNPYEWWGLQENTLTTPRGVTTDLGHLSAFDLGSGTAANYLALSTGINQAMADKGSDARIFAGPNIAGYVGSNFNYKMYDLKCPIEWWDICPEANSVADLRAVQSDKPEVIVWNVAPEFVMAGHEAGFRDGKKSAIRAMQDWVLQGAYSNEYKLVGQAFWTRHDGNTTEFWKTLVLERNN